METRQSHRVVRASHWRHLSRQPSIQPGEPTLFIIDQDAVLRRSLELLALGAGWKIKAFCESEFLHSLQEYAPRCLVVDADQSEQRWLELQQRIATRPDLPVVVLYGGADVRTVVRAMKAGAFEFLVKPFSSGALLGAINVALERSEAALALQARVDELRARHASLSARERQVMALVVRGLLNRDAAVELGISEITVKAHRGNMMRKMAASNVPDLVNMAGTLGQVELWPTISPPAL